jgi:hypothetical protein
MVLVIAVFFVATLTAFMAADRRAAIAMLTAFASRAGHAARALADYAAGIIDRASAELASDSRTRVSLDQLLRPSKRAPGTSVDGAPDP